MNKIPVDWEEFQDCKDSDVCEATIYGVPVARVHRSNQYICGVSKYRRLTVKEIILYRLETYKLLENEFRSSVEHFNSVDAAKVFVEQWIHGIERRLISSRVEDAVRELHYDIIECSSKIKSSQVDQSKFNFLLRNIK
jgi:hypothetical protein